MARRVEIEFVGDRLASARLAQAYAILAPERRRVTSNERRDDEQRGLAGAGARPGGQEVCFAKEPERGGTPEDELLRQFQGMIAEYERAQIRERSRRGKAHRARGGSQAVLSGAPYGYRYVRKSQHMDAFYEIDEGEAEIVREVFDRYTERGESIADIARALSANGVLTRTGKHVLGSLDGVGDAAQPRLPRTGRLR